MGWSVWERVYCLCCTARDRDQQCFACHKHQLLAYVKRTCKTTVSYGVSVYLPVFMNMTAKYKCQTVTFASLEPSQTLKNISHAEHTSPEKNSSWTFGSGADEIFAMYSAMASQNFDTATAHNDRTRYSNVFRNGSCLIIMLPLWVNKTVNKMGFYDNWKNYKN